MKKILVLLLLFLISNITAQKFKFPKWNQFTKSEIALQAYERDTTAHALVLDEVAYAYVEYGGNYEIVKKVYKKIKILDREGLDEANVKLYTYKKERIWNIKATTTNFVGDQPETSKLKKKDMYEEKVDEEHEVISFTLPNVQVGSILEYYYEFRTPYHFDFAHGWTFQSDVPKIRSSYTAKIPGFWVYNISTINMNNVAPKENKLIEHCMRVGNADASCMYFTIELNDIPAFIEEDFMTSRYNYLTRVDFELKTFQDTTLEKDDITKTWKDIDKEIFKETGIGKAFSKNNFKLEMLPDSVTQVSDKLMRAEKVYYYIQKHFNWNGEYYQNIYDPPKLKRAFQNKVGNAMEINLNLVNALKSLGIEADFALLSTRKNGFVKTTHPSINSFNYLIAHINIKGKDYFLDATEKYLPFAVLPVRCLNGVVRVFDQNEQSEWKKFNVPTNNNVTTYVKAHVNADKSIDVRIKKVYDGYSAIKKRVEISDTGISEYKNAFKYDYEVYDIKNLKKTDQMLVEKVEFETTVDNLIVSDKIYFNPFIFKTFETNPFKLQERNYPVDFGYIQQFRNNISIIFDDSFQIDKIPESITYTLPDNGGSYTYVIEKKDHKVQIRSDLKFEKKVYQPDEYELLKSLMNHMIKKENSNVVLKKV